MNLSPAKNRAFHPLFTAISEPIFREKEKKKRLKKMKLPQTDSCPHEGDLNYPRKLSA